MPRLDSFPARDANGHRRHRPRLQRGCHRSHHPGALPADTIRKYQATILGLNLADDYGCLRWWGGKAITQAQVAEWPEYTRAKLPGIPLGVRLTPDWVAAYPPLAEQLDYAWAQYAARKGDAQAFFNKSATIAQRFGLRVVMG
jgi:hypothetical protein